MRKPVAASRIEVLARKLAQAKADGLPPLSSLKTPLDQILWTLAVMRYELGESGYFSCAELVRLLKQLDLAADDQSVRNALARAGKKIDRIGQRKSAIYKITLPGKAHLQGKATEGVQLFYVDGNKPRTDRRVVIDEIGRQLVGDVLIVDKFLGEESLDLLDKLAPRGRIKILSAKLVGNERSLRREIARFITQFGGSEFRLYPNPSHLHDRYVITNRDLFILGHGIKDLGAKESFVVVLRDPFGREMRGQLKNLFNKRWHRSKPLP